jgi:SpoVK/Ycf46/Vps4 family AAA+-type ATPase
MRFAEILRRPPGEIHQAWYVVVEGCSLLCSLSTGETVLAKNVANKCNANFISIRVSSLLVLCICHCRSSYADPAYY